ncbi:MAG: hypothetical protein GF353_00295 [Candidatus Lokiarchaeota archaeon]|nr:hypothetical protein [Candidatus Lokiarchaeota archaeon]
MLRQIIYLLLLTLGFLAFLFPIVDPQLWVDEQTYCVYIEEIGIDPRYAFQLTIALAGIIYPISVGLWAISWAIEDAGLVHYVFQSDGYYEIEPVNVKYTSYLQGYAGLSSIFFIVEIFMYHASHDRLSDSFLVFPPLIIIVLCFFPTYFLFNKILGSHQYLKKNLEEIKKLTKEDLQK